MRTEFIKAEHTFNVERDGPDICLPQSHPEIYALAPWAVAIVPMDGGYMLFESDIDFEAWKRES
jgi:hypothetical protein